MLICIPWCLKDEPQAVRLAEWLRDLGPYQHNLLLTHDKDCLRVNDIRTILTASFKDIATLRVADAPNEWSGGANYMFVRTARFVKESFLWLEPDAIPMRKGWLNEIVLEYREGRKPFMGNFVPALGDSPDHMTGIGIYPANMTQHAGKILWSSSPVGQNGKDGYIPFDLYAAADVLAKATITPLIRHTWKRQSFVSMSEVDALGDCAIFHSSKDGSLIRLLRQKLFGEARIESPDTTEDTAQAEDVGSGPISGRLARSSMRPEEPSVTRHGTQREAAATQQDGVHETAVAEPLEQVFAKVKPAYIAFSREKGITEAVSVLNKFTVNANGVKVPRYVSQVREELKRQKVTR